MTTTNRDVIRTTIFKLFTKGYTHYYIAAELNRRGMRTNRGTKFTETRIQQFCNYHRLFQRGPYKPGALMTALRKGRLTPRKSAA